MKIQINALLVPLALSESALNELSQGEMLKGYFYEHLCNICGNYTGGKYTLCERDSKLISSEVYK